MLLWVSESNTHFTFWLFFFHLGSHYYFCQSEEVSLRISFFFFYCHCFTFTSTAPKVQKTLKNTMTSLQETAVLPLRTSRKTSQLEEMLMSSSQTWQSRNTVPGFFHVFFLRRTLNRTHTDTLFIKNFIDYTLFFELLLCSNKVLPVNAEVKLALLFQLRKQLLFRLSDSHALGKHRVHEELAGLGHMNRLSIFVSMVTYCLELRNGKKKTKIVLQFSPLFHSLVVGILSLCIHPFSGLFPVVQLSVERREMLNLSIGLLTEPSDV